MISANRGDDRRNVGVAEQVVQISSSLRGGARDPPVLATGVSGNPDAESPGLEIRDPVLESMWEDRRTAPRGAGNSDRVTWAQAVGLHHTSPSQRIRASEERQSQRLAASGGPHQPSHI